MNLTDKQLLSIIEALNDAGYIVRTESGVTPSLDSEVRAARVALVATWKLVLPKDELGIDDRMEWEEAWKQDPHDSINNFPRDKGFRTMERWLIQRRRALLGEVDQALEAIRALEIACSWTDGHPPCRLSEASAKQIVELVRATDAKKAERVVRSGR